MTVIPDRGTARSFVVAFRRGEDVVQELREYVRASRIDTGLIVSGIGSFDRCSLHYIVSTEIPPRDVHVSLVGPIEIGSLQGTIAAGEPHIHVVVRNDADGLIYCGDLGPGARCCYRVEIGLLVMDQAKSARRVDPATGLIDIVEVKE